MLIAGGSGHFYLSRDPPPPYTANVTYSTKQPRQITVSFVLIHIVYAFVNDLIMELGKLQT